jgi:hypothetical protein
VPADVEQLIASGIRPQSRTEVLASYARAGLALRDEREEGGWLALALAREPSLAASEAGEPDLAAERRDG